MSDNWYISKNDQRFGPFKYEHLRALAQNGNLATTDLIRQTEMCSWKPAQSVDGLFTECSETTHFLAIRPNNVASTSRNATNDSLWYIGALLLLFGVVGVVAAFNLDTSVEIPGGLRVHNIGLLQERQTRILLFGGAFGLGLVLVLVSDGRGQSGKSIEMEPPWRIEGALIERNRWITKYTLCIGVAFAAVLGCIVLAIISGERQPNANRTFSAVSERISQDGGFPKSDNRNQITFSAYSRIYEGMSYSEVWSIIGTPGRDVASNYMEGIPGVMPSMTTKMYSWSNPDGSNMNAMFQNDKLINKAQAGLR